MRGGTSPSAWRRAAAFPGGTKQRHRAGRWRRWTVGWVVRARCAPSRPHGAGLKAPSIVAPRGGRLTVDPIGEGETMGFKVTATGPNAKIGPAVPPLLAGEGGEDPLDAHRIQPFYAGMLARECGMTANLAMEGEAVVVSAT
ncbi:MAG: histidine phosphotransferase family protein [Deinococcales bacterium]